MYNAFCEALAVKWARVFFLPTVKVVDFLDITLDLRTAIYKPYKRSNSNLTYIHKQSNHPPPIIQNILKSTNKRLSTNSKNAPIFNKACIPYT